MSTANLTVRRGALNLLAARFAGCVAPGVGPYCVARSVPSLLTDRTNSTPPSIPVLMLPSHETLKTVVTYRPAGPVTHDCPSELRYVSDVKLSDGALLLLLTW